MNAKSTRSRTSRKSTPETAEKFPLRVHKGTGYWCKKIRGHVHYFGKVADDPEGDAAREEYDRVKADLEAGREPRERSEAELTVGDLCSRFDAAKAALRDNEEISPRSYADYYRTCETIIKAFGKGRAVTDLQPIDFGNLRAKLAKKRGLVSLRNEMQRVRSVFKFAFDEVLIPAPIRYGQQFAKPKRDAVRRAREEHRREHGDRMFEAADIRSMLDKATQPLRTMILIAANCGFGQSDLANLPVKAVDLETGWIDFARVKTAVPRRIPLWPQTVDAIRDWLTMRPKAKHSADAGLLFLTVRGARWLKVNEKGSPKDAIGQEFTKLLRELNIKRPRVAFYALRHGFETIGGETADQVAVDAIMGHVPKGMAGEYRERISDDRLRKVTDFIRAWLFPPDEKNSPDSESAEAGVADVVTSDDDVDDQPVVLKLFAS